VTQSRAYENLVWLPTFAGGRVDFRWHT
jgi:hypothetical protein